MTTTTTRKRAARPRKSPAKPKAPEKMPLTVALPTYNNARILWLQLESLLRQDTSQPFEVLILECPKDGEYPSEALVAGYVGRFAERGVELKYMKSLRRMPLLSKWIMMARAAQSENLLMVASDNYTPSQAVGKYIDAFNAGVNWIDCPRGVFYDISTQRMASWTMPEGVTGLLFATHSKAVAAIHDTPLARGIDYHIFLNVPHDKRVNMEFPDGVLTDGANTISLHRSALYNTGVYKGRFSEFNGKLEDCVPTDVAKRLHDMKPVVVT